MSYVFVAAVDDQKGSLGIISQGIDYHTMPVVVWTYEASSDPMSSRLMDIVLRKWSLANRYGLRIRNVSYFGRSLTAREVELCNLLILSRIGSKPATQDRIKTS